MIKNCRSCAARLRRALVDDRKAVEEFTMDAADGTAIASPWLVVRQRPPADAEVDRLAGGFEASGELVSRSGSRT
jgi:hypothetical protein